MKYKKDYYKILHVTPSATMLEIRNIYRRLAILKHPDRDSSPQATAEMQDINEAYSILGNGDKRKKYDLEYMNLWDTSHINYYNTRKSEKVVNPLTNVLEQITKELKFVFSSILSGYRKNKYPDKFKQLTIKVKLAFTRLVDSYQKSNVKQNIKEKEDPPDIYKQIKKGLKIVFISLAIIEIALLIAMIFIALS